MQQYGVKCPVCCKTVLVDIPDCSVCASRALEVQQLCTLNEMHDVCLSYRHDYGLMDPKDQEILRFQSIEWLRAWKKTLGEKKEGPA